ncbi:MAG: hypothetical protein QG573_249 [Acidobacteriota bacterium]|nr:hypothetical protein [Acidobacteriota bacterium]
MRLSRRRTVIVSTFVLAALLGGCFEPPVAERMLLEFLSDGAARATLMIDLGRAEDFESPAVRKRIATAERELAAGTAPWLGRFESLTQGADGTSFQRTRGALREFRRWAELDDPAAFSELFAGDPVDFQYSRNGDRAALEISASGASRATRKERELVQREVAEWSLAFSQYVERVFELERLLVDQPEKRKGCWQRVFGVKGDGGDDGEDGDGQDAASEVELAPAEAAVAKAVGDSLAALLGAFEIDSREGYSLDERVRRVFHPLSAQLLVTLPAPALEVEGFDSPSPEEQAGEEEHAYAFPERSLLATLDALEARWLAVGPARALLDHLRTNPDSEMDIECFVSGPVIQESATPPGVTDVSDPLLELLRPEGAYRLVWQVPSADRP